MQHSSGFCEEQMIALIRKFFVLLSLLALSFVLIACAEEEQNRVLSYDKGTYLGKMDQKLTENQLRQLVRRSDGQRDD
jgi:hypothetical protein